MRKRLISNDEHLGEEWLLVDQVATVEVSSEDPEHPVDAALLPGAEGGWRAAASGPQTIRLMFDQPQRIRHIRLIFNETSVERTQEFLLGWSGDRGQPFREIVRQQWTFSPQGATRELEDYEVDLTAVSALELRINPNISGGNAVASLTQWLVA